MSIRDELVAALGNQRLQIAQAMGESGCASGCHSTIVAPPFHLMTHEELVQTATLLYGVIELNKKGFEPDRGECRNVAEPDEYSDRPFTCSECGARGPMGDGTYHMPSVFTMPDGTSVHADSWPIWKYCPHCGRRVIDDRCETMAGSDISSQCEEAEQ